MDPLKFDAFARLLARTATRRSGLRAALAAAGGAATGGGTAEAGRIGPRNLQGGRPGTNGPCGDGSDNHCTKNEDCCTGYCKRVAPGRKRCRCIERGKKCTSRQTCCGALNCKSGRCKADKPEPAKIATGAACSTGDVCINPAASCAEPASGCPGTRCLLALGEPCSDRGDCQSGACVSGVCLACSCAACANACVPTVGCQGCPHQTIQAAIDAATSGDVIMIAPGTYNESLAIKAKNLTLRGCTAEGPVVIKNAQYGTATLEINDEFGLSLYTYIDLIDITVSGYYVKGGGADTYGGGIWVYGATLNLCGSTSIADNYTNYGAVNCNTMAGLPDPDLHLWDTSTIENNFASDSYGAAGLTTYNTAAMHGSSAVRNNVGGPRTGGVYVGYSGTFLMEDAASVSGNSTAAGEAGGIFGQPNIDNPAKCIEMRHCSRVSANTSSVDAAGIHLGCPALITGDASITGNTAAGNGGGVYMPQLSNPTALTIQGEATVTGNSAASGGGIFSEADPENTVTGGAAVTGNTPDNCVGVIC